MKLETLKIKNFRGFKTETVIPMDNLTAFIGKNDAGKSTVLEALEIFFNNSLVSIEKQDLNVNADNNDIEICCVFSEFPGEIIIDAAFPTSLENEHLLNSENKLEIRKVYPATAAKPKENIYIVCQHPSVENGNDLLTLKRTELTQRIEQLHISEDEYNGRINSSMRQAIWDSFNELQLEEQHILVDKEDTKKVYETLKNYLPMYALFQSDRQSKDEDKEVTDPMKIAIKQALTELNTELEYIKNEVRNKAVDTATRTLEKLHEMSPELANVLVPEFKTEPKFDSQFKLTIKSEDDIPINKRGSGIRRLVLLNFFRAEAERLRNQQDGNQIIFAFEEPETSQHPDHQEMLIEAFLNISNSGNSQVILTTHTPALASLIPLSSLRFIEKQGTDRTVELGTEEVFEKIADTLGILADPLDKNARAILLLEGKSDITFVNHTAGLLFNGGFIEHTFADKNIALVPVGGCGNIKHWRTLKLAEQFDIPYCVLMDSDKGTTEEQKNQAVIQNLVNDGIKAYLTRKREPENYIHLDCLNLEADSTFTFTDTCDAKVLIAQEKTSRKQNVIEDYYTNMTIEQLREVEHYTENGEDKYEFSEMFNDFLSIVD